MKITLKCEHEIDGSIVTVEINNQDLPGCLSAFRGFLQASGFSFGINEELVVWDHRSEDLIRQSKEAWESEED